MPWYVSLYTIVQTLLVEFSQTGTKWLVIKFYNTEFYYQFSIKFH